MRRKQGEAEADDVHGNLASVRFCDLDSLVAVILDD
jgi:hypothetical protein